jgi:hypothetical protein
MALPPLAWHNLLTACRHSWAQYAVSRLQRTLSSASNAAAGPVQYTCESRNKTACAPSMSAEDNASPGNSVIASLAWTGLVPDALVFSRSSKARRNPRAAPRCAYTDQLIFFVAPHSPLAERPDLGWEDVHDHTLVGHYLEPFWPQYWTTLRNPPIPPNHVVDVSTPEAVKRIRRVDRCCRRRCPHRCRP